MAKAIPIRPRTGPSSTIAKQPIAIIASKFNKEYVDALIESCVGELKELLPDALIHVARVPGAFEIPVTVKHMSNQNINFGCFIALGVIVQGETAHGNHVGSSVSNGLMDLSINLNTPVINEVLHVENLNQARVRCFEPELNRGVEAARTAYSMLNIFENLKG